MIPDEIDQVTDTLLSNVELDGFIVHQLERGDGTHQVLSSVAHGFLDAAETDRATRLAGVSNTYRDVAARLLDLAGAY